MKKIALVAIAMCLSYVAMSQNSTQAPKKQKLHELGITFQGINNFGATYRVGNAHSLWRFNTLFALESQNQMGNQSIQSFSSGFSVGKEFRKNITSKLQFRYGLDVGFKYQYSTLTTKDSLQTILRRDVTSQSSPFLHIVLGFNYLINNNFIVGFEVLPGINYQIGHHKYTVNTSSGASNLDKIRGIYYGFDTEPVKISIIYRFRK